MLVIGQRSKKTGQELGQTFLQLGRNKKISGARVRGRVIYRVNANRDMDQSVVRGITWSTVFGVAARQSTCCARLMRGGVTAAE